MSKMQGAESNTQSFAFLKERRIEFRMYAGTIRGLSDLISGKFALELEYRRGMTNADIWL